MGHAMGGNDDFLGQRTPDIDTDITTQDPDCLSWPDVVHTGSDRRHLTHPHRAREGGEGLPWRDPSQKRERHPLGSVLRIARSRARRPGQAEDQVLPRAEASQLLHRSSSAMRAFIGLPKQYPHARTRACLAAASNDGMLLLFYST